MFKRLLVIGFLGLGACTQTSGIDDDPYAAQNRAVHSFNKGLDKAVLRPVSTAYGDTVPSEVRASLSNASDNLSLPGAFLNHVLQGDLQDEGATFMRFGFNSTFGLAGLRDPASDAGLFARNTSFGETLAVWGVRQGAYIELPLFGPSDERDATGKVVDFVINPLNALENPIPGEITGTLTAASLLNRRYEFRAIVNTLLYESADSYNAQRIAYLQNQAASLSGGVVAEDLEDPYAFE
ncbi:MAG: VacJ family lipoprotein [Pseudomonadota bacterium]